MPSIAHTAEFHIEPRGAQALVRHVPRDQALGLRLVALAEAAAAMHMGEVAMSRVDLGTSQAARLVREAKG